MKMIIAFAMTIPWFYCISQTDSVYYNLVVINGCSGEEIENYTYNSVQNVDMNTAWFHEYPTSQVKIQKGKSYNVIRYEDFDKYKTISLDSNWSDTMSTSCFMENNNRYEQCCVTTWIEPDFIDTLFHIEGVPINGLFTEYFWDGNLRVQGTFDNGKLDDTLKLFFRTGEPKSTFVVKNKRKWELSTNSVNGERSFLKIQHGNKQYRFFKNDTESFKTKKN